MTFFICTLIVGFLSFVTSLFVDGLLVRIVFFSFAVFVCVPICFAYLMNLSMLTLKNGANKEKVERMKAECKRASKTKETKTKKKYESKVVENEQYKSLVEFLKFSMQQKLLNRQDVLKFKKEINLKLGEYVDNYCDFEFQNDLHEIYTKLKSSHLSSKDYEELLESLETYVV